MEQKGRGTSGPIWADAGAVWAAGATARQPKADAAEQSFFMTWANANKRRLSRALKTFRTLGVSCLQLPQHHLSSAKREKRFFKMPFLHRFL